MANHHVGVTNMEPLKTATITIDENEAVNLIKLIDIACKSAGLPVAGVASSWHSKLHFAFNPEEKKCLAVPTS